MSGNLNHLTIIYCSVKIHLTEISSTAKKKYFQSYQTTSQIWSPEEMYQKDQIIHYSTYPEVFFDIHGYSKLYPRKLIEIMFCWSNLISPICNDNPIPMSHIFSIFSPNNFPPHSPRTFPLLGTPILWIFQTISEAIQFTLASVKCLDEKWKKYWNSIRMDLFLEEWAV